jgi:hypothetical protein
MSELTVITTEAIGSSVGSLELKGRWRIPAHFEGARQLDRPWHREELAVPLGAIAVPPERVLRWENRAGITAECSHERSVYLLGLLAVPWAIEGGETDEGLVEAMANPRQAHILGYEASRRALAGLVQRYVDKDAGNGTHYIMRATAEYSRHYKPPDTEEEIETLLAAIRAALPEESAA